MSTYKNSVYITILSGLCAVLVLAGCDRNYETIFNESPDERAQAALDHYNALLMDAPFGWKATLYTGAGPGFFYYMDFNGGGKVSMLSDFDETTAGEEEESSWTLKSLLRPTLSFTTYSYIHLPADPDRDGGIPGSGLLSDSEFAIMRTSGDSVVLQGTQHGAQMIFVKAVEAEVQAIRSNRIQDLLQYTDQYLDAFEGYRLTLPDGTVAPVVLSIPQKLIALQYLDDDGETIRIPASTYTFSIEGIELKDPVEVHGYTIRRLLWNDDDGAYYVPFDTPETLAGTDDPFIFNTITPLHEVVGDELVTAVVPEGAGADPLPGQSDSFTAAYNDLAADMLDGEHRLTLRDITFRFVPNTDLMQIDVIFTQVVNGALARYRGRINYSYALREDGSLKFRFEGSTSDYPAYDLYEKMYGILVHFDNDAFTLEYLGGGFYPIFAFFSKEEPSFHFSGHVYDNE